ncbi:MAG: amidohydrolase [Clostridia bacterium]|nr:amidohydrolase [Clostridia bacterium]
MKNLLNAVEKYRDLILETEKYIWEHPETGYREYKTSKFMEEKFIELGYDITRAENITGFYTTIDTGREGPTLLILGELDSIICPTHKSADKETGAVHSCGHNAQCAALIGIAAALKEPNALDGLSGKIKLCAVPAEELLEIEYRNELMAKGIIKYYGGKPEFLYRGYFDDVDIAFMVHTTCMEKYATKIGSVGCLAKQVIYKGVASHAGSIPWEGRNALYAATCGLNACNAIRETFKEKDIIRFHPIITRAGEMVNAIPDKAVIESYVRGKTFDAMKKANYRLNQALCGAALSLDNNIEIIDKPGYAPLLNDKNMIPLIQDALKVALPEEEFLFINEVGSGSTDMGDLSAIMPVIHPYAPGAKGTSHGSDYQIVDKERACVGSAKWQLAILYLLLKDGAERAKTIIKEHKPMFSSKQEYFENLSSFDRDGDRIIYSSDGNVSVKL